MTMIQKPDGLVKHVIQAPVLNILVYHNQIWRSCTAADNRQNIWMRKDSETRIFFNELSGSSVLKKILG